MANGGDNNKRNWIIAGAIIAVVVAYLVWLYVAYYKPNPNPNPDLGGRDFVTPALYFFSAAAQTMGAFIAIVLAAMYAIVPNIRPADNNPASEPARRLLLSDPILVRSIYLSFAMIGASLLGLIVIYTTGNDQQFSKIFLFGGGLLTFGLGVLAIKEMYIFIFKRMSCYCNPTLLLEPEFYKLNTSNHQHVANTIELNSILKIHSSYNDNTYNKFDFVFNNNSIHCDNLKMILNYLKYFIFKDYKTTFIQANVDINKLFWEIWSYSSFNVLGIYQFPPYENKRILIRDFLIDLCEITDRSSLNFNDFFGPFFEHSIFQINNLQRNIYFEEINSIANLLDYLLSLVLGYREFEVLQNALNNYPLQLHKSMLKYKDSIPEIEYKYIYCKLLQIQYWYALITLNNWFVGNNNSMVNISIISNLLDIIKDIGKQESTTIIDDLFKLTYRKKWSMDIFYEYFFEADILLRYLVDLEPPNITKYVSALNEHRVSNEITTLIDLIDITFPYNEALIIYTKIKNSKITIGRIKSNIRYYFKNFWGDLNQNTTKLLKK